MDDLSTVVFHKNEITTKRCVAGYLTDLDKVTIGYTDESIHVFQLPIEWENSGNFYWKIPEKSNFSAKNTWKSTKNHKNE